MFAEIFTLIINTVASLYLLIVLLRFVFQIARADFYNPISQFVVKATNPLLIPLRRLIPGIGGIDIASLILAIAIQALALVALMLVASGGISADPLSILVVSLVKVAGLMIDIYFWSLLIMIIASWVAPGSGHPALVLINQIVEPLMAPFRRLLPPMGGLDLSPILVFLVLQILKVVLSYVYI